MGGLWGKLAKADERIKKEMKKKKHCKRVKKEAETSIEIKIEWKE